MSCHDRKRAHIECFCGTTINECENQNKDETRANPREYGLNLRRALSTDTSKRRIKEVIIAVAARVSGVPETAHRRHIAIIFRATVFAPPLNWACGASTSLFVVPFSDTTARRVSVGAWKRAE
jgi:hypothetical protein